MIKSSITVLQKTRFGCTKTYFETNGSEAVMLFNVFMMVDQQVFQREIVW